MRRVCCLLVAWVAVVGVQEPVFAAELPPVSAEHESLESVPEFPEAPAVVLYRNGHFTMMGALGSETYSSLEVEGRIKLLTDEGTDFGEVEVAHNDFVRLVDFTGRTILPDGRTVPLPEDALFETTVSGRKRWSVTTATFPALEPGAILDYRYELRFESINSFDPWYFQDHIPTLHSEIVYTIPGNVAALPWGRATFGRQLQSERERMARGQQLRVWMDDLPPIPDEPLSFPFEDLSSSFMLLPTIMEVSGNKVLLFEDWRSACDVVDYTYAEVRRRDGRTRRAAKRLVKERDLDRGDEEARARAVFEFVRDEVGTVSIPGIIPRLGEDLDEMLRSRRGDTAGKGLMLREMLDAVGVEAELVWTPDRDYGMVDLSIANPNWFEKVLVRAEIDGEEVFLDPAEPGVPFGYLLPELEGMPAVVFGTRSPEVIELPEAPFEANARRASVELDVDEDGGVTGTGSMVLAGHHAARWLRTAETATALEEELVDELGDRFSGYDVTDVAVTAERDAVRIEVEWALTLREEEVLGDQSTVVPARPLGPLSQRFTLEPSQRLTPVLLSFADRDEVEMTVRWPEGWVADVVPGARSFDNGAGAYAIGTELDEEARTLRYTRRFDTRMKSFVGRPAYTALRELYGAVAEGDDRDLVLIRLPAGS